MVNKPEKVVQNKSPVDDWDFEGLKQSERQYGVHFFHHYTAKFIPQIPTRIINRFGKKGCAIVDPFMGSGTTLVESKMLGFDSYGLDTNPLAVKITQSKTLELNDKRIDEIDNFLNWLEENKSEEEKLVSTCFENLLFPNSHLWFRNDVAYKISLVLNEIENFSPELINFIEIGLSTLLKGMSNARMDSVTPILPKNHVYIDRKHYYREVNNLSRNIPVFGRMFSQLRRMRTAIIEFNKNYKKGIICAPILGDARFL